MPTRETSGRHEDAKDADRSQAIHKVHRDAPFGLDLRRTGLNAGCHVPYIGEQVANYACVCLLEIKEAEIRPCNGGQRVFDLSSPYSCIQKVSVANSW